MGLNGPGHNSELEEQLAELRSINRGFRLELSLLTEQISKLTKQNERYHNITQGQVSEVSTHLQKEFENRGKK